MWLDKCTEPYKIRTICALTFVLFESGDCEGVRILGVCKDNGTSSSVNNNDRQLYLQNVQTTTVQTTPK